MTLAGVCLSLLMAHAGVAPGFKRTTSEAILLKFPYRIGKILCRNRFLFYICNPKTQRVAGIWIQDGSLAQLVQSICLTSRGSGVRTPQLPLHRRSLAYARWFYERVVLHPVLPFQ